MKGNNRHGRQEPLSAPPNPQALRQQAAAEQAANAQKWREFVAQKVMPWVNTALNSSEYVMYDAGRLSIKGLRTRVAVSSTERDATWVVYVLEALNGPSYKGYTVKFQGVSLAGGHWRAAGLKPETIELDTNDVLGAARRFQKLHPRGYLRVVIAP